MENSSNIKRQLSKQHIENVIDDNILETYIQWRFVRNNINKYRKYYEEWRSGVTPEQLQYFGEEMKRLILSGGYQP